MDFDLPTVFLPQTADGLQIARKILHGHANVANKVAGIGPGCVIRKTELIKARLQGRKHICFIFAHGMVTTHGMCMIIALQGSMTLPYIKQ